VYLGLTSYTWSAFKSDIDDAFMKLEECKDDMDQRTKVMHLLHAIKAPFLFDSVNLVRQLHPADYNEASIYIANAILQKGVNSEYERNKPHRHISEIHTGRYTEEEWAALSDTEKREVQRLRKERKSGHGGRGETQGRSNGNQGRGRSQNHNQGRGRGRQGRGQGRGRGGSGSGRGRPGGRGIIRQVQQVQGHEIDYEKEPQEFDDEWEYDADEAVDDAPIEPRRGTTTN